MAVSSHFEASDAKGVNGNQNDKSIPQAGAVYVFTRSGSRWTQQAYVKPWNTTVRGQLFGYRPQQENVLSHRRKRRAPR